MPAGFAALRQSVRERDDRDPNVGDNAAPLSHRGRRERRRPVLSGTHPDPCQEPQRSSRGPAEESEPAVLPQRRPLEPHPLNGRLPAETSKGLAESLGLRALAGSVEAGEGDELTSRLARTTGLEPGPYPGASRGPTFGIRPFGERRSTGAARDPRTRAVGQLQGGKRPVGPPRRSGRPSHIECVHVFGERELDPCSVLRAKAAVALDESSPQCQEQMTRGRPHEPVVAWQTPPPPDAVPAPPR